MTIMVIGIIFPMTVGVRQVSLLSPVLFNIFLEIIIQDTLENHQSIIIIVGRLIFILQFAEDMYLLAGSECVLHALTDSLKSVVKISYVRNSPYMKRSSRMLKMSNILLRCLLKTERKIEMLIRLSTATAAIVRLGTIWKYIYIYIYIEINLKYKLNKYNSKYNSKYALIFSFLMYSYIHIYYLFLL